MPSRDRDDRQDDGVARLDKTSITASEFLSEIFGELPEGELCLVAKQKTLEGGFLQMSAGASAFDVWARRGRRGAWYFCVSTVVPQEPDAEGEPVRPRRRKKDCVAACCVVLDDVGTKVDPVAQDLPPPSWVLETSPGNFQWGYILGEPSSDWELYEGFLRALAAEEATDAGSVDRSHVFRVPGSENLKPEHEGFRARLVAWDPDRDWTLGELIDLFGMTEEECRAAAVPSVRRSADGQRRLGAITLPEGMEIADPVLEWLEAQGRIVGAGDGEWVHVRCPWEASHTTVGETSTSYSPLGRGGSEFQMSRGFKCQHGHCSGRKTRAFLDWVESEGGPRANVYDPLAWLQRQYVVVVQDLLVADLDQRPLGGRWIVKKAEFDLMVPGTYRTLDRDNAVRLSTAFMESRETVKAARQVYLPEHSEAVVEEAGQVCLNTYARPWHPEDAGEPTVFLAHMDYLIPDAGERAVFLDWMAFKLQNPGRRPFSVIMVADEAFGTGRGWLATLLEMVFRDVKYTHLAKLAGEEGAARFNEWEWRAQIVVVEEAKDVLEGGKQYHAYENMKRRVDTSPRAVEIDVKSASKIEARRYYTVLIFSNHSDALVLPAADRRFMVVTNATEARPDAYYKALYGALEAGEAARTFRWLMARDVSEFDFVRAPMTAGKAAMIEQTGSPLDEIVAAAVEAARGDLVGRTDLLRLLERTRDSLGYTEAVKQDQLEHAAKRLWRKLGSLDETDRKHGYRVRVRGEQVELRALREKSRWAREIHEMTPESLAYEASKNGPDFKPGAPKLTVHENDETEN